MYIIARQNTIIKPTWEKCASLQQQQSQYRAERRKIVKKKKRRNHKYKSSKVK